MKLAQQSLCNSSHVANSNLQGSRIVLGWNPDIVKVVVILYDAHVMHVCDFNVSLSVDDKSIGTSYIDIGMQDFQECVEDLELLVVNSTRLRFTWNQKPKGGDDRFLSQKAKVDWLQLGDANTAYFHKVVKSHASRNCINSVTTAEAICVDGDQVSVAFIDHYTDFLGQQGVPYSFDTSDLFCNQLTNDTANHMVCDITDKEIWDAIFSMGMRLRVQMELNHTIISLIPKVTSTMKINDYRPISCFNVPFKCSSRIISNRMKESLSDLVSLNQSAFVPGRRISDNILLTQELIHNYHLDRGTPRCAFKVDIQKAYDTVDWIFLHNVLVGFGFHLLMTGWIMECVTFTSFSLSINGCLHGYFKGKRGLRQGDPMSPYLFTLVMEVLTLMLHQRDQESNSFTYHQCCSKLNIINLCFADDLFLFAHGDVNYARLDILNILPFEEGKFLVKYLGVPLVPSRLVHRDCFELIEKGKMRKGRAKVAWDDVCLPKDEGGLVIINGDSPIPESRAIGTVVPPKTEAQKLARKNKLKAKSTLLLAIPDEHLLKFHSIKDAKSLWKAIKTSQSNTLQLVNKDLDQIDTNDLEKIDLKWQVAMITMRVKRFIKKTRRNLNFNSKESGDNKRRVIPVETPASILVVQDGLGGYDWSYQAEEGPTDFALMAHSLDSANSSNSETGLGYDSQLSENEMPKFEIFKAASNSSVSEIDEDNNQPKDRYKVGIGYHAVPPPYTENYMPPRADLSFAGLDDSVFKFKISETRTSVNENESIASKSSKEIRDEPKTVRSSAPIIEDWESESEDECVDKSLTKQDKSSNDNSVKSNDCTRENIFEKHTNNHDENLRKRQDSKREFSVARTPQQNGVAERKNRTLIEAARTMLANSFLPTTFWAEAVNTACYVQNKVLVTNPHYKTPYGLLICRLPNLEFMRPFGCLVTILNTLDHLGKFDGKPDEGFLVGYFVNSKAFRVFNSRTRKVEENLHVNFLETKPNVAGSGPKWLFDIDSLTKSINYEPVTAGDQSNDDAGDVNVGYKVMLMRYQEMMILNINTADSNHTNIPTLEATGIINGAFDDRDLGVEADTNNLTLLQLRMINFSEQTAMAASLIGREEQIIKIFRTACFLSQIEPKKVFRNKLDERGIVIRNKARLVAQGHTQEEGIDYDEVFASVVRIEAIRLFLAYASFKDFIVYQMEVKSVFLYEKIEKEVYVCQPPRFEDPDFPDKLYKVIYGLHQAPRACQDKYVAEILKKFGFSEVKNASTPMETSKPLLKDEDGKEVDVHMYKSMIGSFMYLTSSRPYIMSLVSKDSPFELEAYIDSNYAGSSLDMKSTTGGCQFLGCRLISWQCKKQTVVANSTTEAEYVDALSCCGQTTAKVKKVDDEVQIQALVDGKWVNIKESSIRRTLRLEDAESTSCLTNTEIFEGLARMGYETPSNKLTFYKAFFSPQWKFLVHTILQCLSAKTTSWNEFSSTMASAIICIATNHKFNFSRYILLSLVKNIEKKHKPKRKHTKEPEIPPTESQAKQNIHLPSPSHDLLPSGEDSLKLKELIDLCTNLSNKVLDLESEVIDIKSTLKANIEKLESRVERLEEENRVLKEFKGVYSTVDYDEPVMEKEKSSKHRRKIADINADVEINLEKAQAEAYNLDLDHQEKVLIMLDVNDEEPPDVKEVLEDTPITAASVEVPKPRKRKGVIIQDPEETITTATVQPKIQAKDKGKAILIEESNPLKRKKESPKERETNRCNNEISSSKEKAFDRSSSQKEYDCVFEEHGWLQDRLLQGMSYDEIRPLFEKHYNYNQVFLNEVNEGVKVPEKEMEQESEELKKHLQIVPDDDVYTDATSLALKIPIIDYKIYTERNRPYFKIIRADGNHRERFSKTEPKNYSDDFLLNTFKVIFEKPNVEANVWKDQKGKYGLAKVKR
nr:hypothetical protein [Tanacetum cinerariifolium]